MSARTMADARDRRLADATLAVVALLNVLPLSLAALEQNAAAANALAVAGAGE